MTCPISNISGNVGSLVARYTALIVLIFGPCLSSAFAEEAQQEPAATDVSEQTSRPLGEPLTDFEKMEIHHRRYSTAANNMAQLYKQLNQKIQEVSLAAKTAEIKDSSHNRRQLETKLRQLEMARTSYNTQYTQLYSQMQNESRNYATLSNNLKVKHDAVKDSSKREDTSGETKGAKVKPAKTRETKAKDSKVRNAKTRDVQTDDLPFTDSSAKDPRIMDMDTEELRSKRDGTMPSPAPTSGSNPGPALNVVR
ncbi:hypothetical protein [Nitrosovibrio sp. Nv4]|uniref:hypothetical protein n=1 Tax=Nitrosovibrio sp. Nv4 TaxID=1945880 RepID=UPI000BC675C3|nr:hypothetical protein [Nitrosovibrio sp. Nv4]SOD41640.1 hypothetical protein SAMN06298226_1942 [Nitrosovibrio sp. Nv4]